MRSLFVMDPLQSIVVEGDSTYAIMRECCDRGLPVWMCTPQDLFSRDGRAGARVTEVHVTAHAPWFEQRARMERDLDSFDVVWMRKDPPFDIRYILTTYLLDMVPETTRVVNGAHGLKLFNEKLWVQSHYSDLHPPTLVSSHTGQLRAFVEQQEGKTVLKPWDGNGGRGIVVTYAGDRNLGALLDLLTFEGREHVIAQAHLPSVEQGDKRIILFDGEPVGALLRIPCEHDHRANMHVGARVEAVELNARDREICARLSPALKRWGLLFTGIDVIGGHLTEINITSPTGIREINRLNDVHLEARLVDLVQSKCGGI